MFNPFFSTRARGSWIPAVDLSDHGDSYHLVMDLPHVDKSDVSVYTEGDGVLCISGKRLRQKDEEQDRSLLLLSERGFGSFVRCFELPTRFRDEDVKATFKDSKLTVNVAKTAPKEGSSGSVKIE